MGIIKWYKRDPRAALIGMMDLSLEECGAYNKILDLIYCNDGALADNEASICRVLNCNARTWRRIKARLLEVGKLYIHAGCLRNERADIEIPKAKSLVANAILANDKRWGALRIIKGLGDPNRLQPTTTLVSKLSAKTVPTFKRENEDSGD